MTIFPSNFDKLHVFRIIPANSTRNDIKESLRILNGFWQGYPTGNSTDVNTIQQFINANNLTIPKIMDEIGLVNSS